MTGLDGSARAGPDSEGSPDDPKPVDRSGDPVYLCFIEAYNFLAIEENRLVQNKDVTDFCPVGMSSVLHTYARSLNDILPEYLRQKLKDFLPGGKGPSPDNTHRDSRENDRRFLAAHWILTTYVPACLDLAALPADELRSLPLAFDFGTLVAQIDTAESIVRPHRLMDDDQHTSLHWCGEPASMISCQWVYNRLIGLSCDLTLPIVDPNQVSSTVTLLHQSLIDLFPRMIHPEETA